jgi:CHAD domain-containing protein
MRWEETATAAANARRVLPAMSRAWFEQGVKAARDTSGPRTLHEFRLRTKHFRYTLEMFRQLYGPGLEQRLIALRDLQRRLGDINDCAMAGTLVSAALAKASPERERATRFLAGCEQQRTAAFRRYWKRSFGPAGTAERWSRYLARPR